MKGGWDPELPSNLDAAVTWKGRNYFFKGCISYAYDHVLKKIAWKNDIPTAWNAPCNLDAATTRGDYVYLFKGRNVYQWAYNEDKFIAGPYDIKLFDSTVPGNLNAGFQWIYNKAVFLLKDDKYWVINENGNTEEKLTGVGFRNLYDSSLFSECGCDCTNRAVENSWEFVSIKYNTDDGKVQLLPPTEVRRSTIYNRGTNKSYSVEFRVSTPITETISFFHTDGTSLAVGTEFECVIPVVLNGQITTEVSGPHEFAYGIVKSLAKTKEEIFFCQAAANAITTCIASLQMQEIEVPYSMTLRHKIKRCECMSKGIIRAVSAADMFLTVN